MRLLSSRPPPDEERSSILSTCVQECELGGLDLSTVLQEMIIGGYPPIYWAIVNRAVASENGDVTRDSLIFALLDACRPLSSATVDNIRLACMRTSDNVLLQQLLKDMPPLSPLSAKDVLLLGPHNLRDHVDVQEKVHGTGSLSFVVYIKMPRFRLRLRILNTLAVEFVASCEWATSLSFQRPDSLPISSQVGFGFSDLICSKSVRLRRRTFHLRKCGMRVLNWEGTHSRQGLTQASGSQAFRILRQTAIATLLRLTHFGSIIRPNYLLVVCSRTNSMKVPTYSMSASKEIFTSVASKAL
jgi:hypothetical protein